jgi:NAD(P)-dependent dehydrogenase (short-subunit alcohol dehydrogenase family)
MMRAIEGMSLLVTGGGTGIGAATARTLAADGWLVGLVGRRPEPLEAVAAETGGLALAGNAADLSHLEAGVATLVAAGGNLRALICCAGGGNAGTALTQTQAGFEEVLRQNLTAPFLAAKACLPSLIDAGGSIVITLKLAAASAVPVDVVMTTSDNALLPVPAIITIPAGQLTLQQVITVGATGVKKAVLLKASTQTVPKQLTVNVNP